MTDITEKTALSLINRPRRLRLNSTLRRMVRETDLTPSDFIFPLFIDESATEKVPIGSMVGHYRHSFESLKIEIKELVALGIPAVILFGIPARKDWRGSENYNPQGVIPRAIRIIKDIAPEMIVISDMCCCEYTAHGHCGIINHQDHDGFNHHLPHGYLHNDLTLDILAQASLIHAQAGADIIAPSGMIDGMVGAIRNGLDGGGYEHITIMSYAVKMASGFYNPFRDAADSAPSFGDRKQYQMDFANRREAMREVALDVNQGADILMIKPALLNLDIIRDVREGYPLPIAAYQVSGEYAMLQAAGLNGWLDLRRCAMESLMSIKRAGADLIVTYFAKDAVRWLAE
ncbi:MAG: porphobilinogen synthase [bacterium]|nr:porphobilinogen synthase [bacterium]